MITIDSRHTSISFHQIPLVVKSGNPFFLAPVGEPVDVRSGHSGDDQAHPHDGKARKNLEPQPV